MSRRAWWWLRIALMMAAFTALQVAFDLGGGDLLLLGLAVGLFDAANYIDRRELER